MSLLRSFARRLLVQSLVSGIVMAGLQVAARFGPELFPAPERAAAVEEPASAPAQATAPAPPAAISASASGFAEDPTGSNVRAGRFSVWRERDATAKAISPRRLASSDMGTGLGDVMLFDRCRPDCESRDPLLAFNMRPAATADPKPSPASEVSNDLVASSLPGTADVDGDEGLPQGEGLVAVAMKGGLSVARRLVDTAGSVIGW